MSQEGRDPLGQGSEEEVRAPFTFKLMIVLVVIYLGYRLVQGVVWVIEWIRG